MKLATYRDGSRDGQLVVVSRDLSTAHYATGIATRMQQVLDDWNFLSPQLEDLSTALQHGKARHAFPFDPAMCLAPLPRPAGRLTALACPAAVARRLHAQGQPLPEAATGAPLLRAGGGEPLWGAADELALAHPAGELDVETGLAVVTGDLPAGSPPARALESVRLLMLAADWVLRALERAEAAEAAAWGGAAGAVLARLGTHCSPVAITPDELGPAWQGGRVHLPLAVERAGRALSPVALQDGPFHVGQLLAQAARTRPLAAGTVVFCGPAGPSEAPDDEALAAALQPGDRVRVQARGADRAVLWGAIDATVAVAEVAP